MALDIKAQSMACEYLISYDWGTESITTYTWVAFQKKKKKIGAATTLCCWLLYYVEIVYFY